MSGPAEAAATDRPPTLDRGAILHLVFAEPGAATFRQALRTLRTGDAVILAGHGVLGATRADWATAMAELDDVLVGALLEDLEERGLADRVDEAVTVLDDRAWLAWLFRYPRVRTWL